MDPISLALGIGGVAMSAFGGLSAAGISSQISNLSQNEVGLEGDVNNQKYQAMELSSRRQQTENMRNAQRQRSQATAAATSDGAQLGSGLQGGLAGVTDQSTFNALGINQNTQIGQNIFGLDASISNDKRQIAGLQGQQATDQGIASLGGALTSSAGTIGKLAQSAPGALSKIGSLFS
jgi:hypothetical protein